MSDMSGDTASLMIHKILQARLCVSNSCRRFSMTVSGNDLHGSSIEHCKFWHSIVCIVGVHCVSWYMLGEWFVSFVSFMQSSAVHAFLLWRLLLWLDEGLTDLSSSEWLHRQERAGVLRTFSVCVCVCVLCSVARRFCGSARIT